MPALFCKEAEKQDCPFCFASEMMEGDGNSNDNEQTEKLFKTHGS